ncbi:integrase [Gossypium australe]|uniref:Integrase n=1 Tax=Gossypium australe TaxID=47621 RepID=A0A5B6VUN2_9ROSI|nr:integrase [Gossypium australe]
MRHAIALMLCTLVGIKCIKTSRNFIDGSERVTMDFVSGFLLTPTKKYSVWVIIDRLTKSSYSLPIRTNYSL